MKKSLKISILTPSYNSKPFIERAINSVQTQKYQNWEHIIVDGESTDGSVEIIKKFPSIHWVSEADKGQSDAMNKAFQMSSGDIIGYLNADDFYEERIFSKVSAYFEKYSECQFLTGKLIKIENEKREIRVPEIKLRSILELRKKKFPLNPVSYFYRREVQESLGDFPTGNHLTMDYWFLLRVYKDYEIHYLDEIFGYFDSHGKNKTSTHPSFISLVKLREEFLEQNSILATQFKFRRMIRKFGFW